MTSNGSPRVNFFDKSLTSRPATALCDELGIKAKGEAWLKAHGVPVYAHQHYRRGRPTPLICREDLIRAVRSDQNGWPNWKPFEFECKVRRINPIRELAIIVLSCFPDYELLKAALSLCVDPESNLLFWVATDDFDENSSYAYYGLETWIGKELRRRINHPDFVQGYNKFVQKWDDHAFVDLWIKLRKDVESWPILADEYDYKIYEGALLLGEPIGLGTDRVEIRNFIIRCPSYIKRFKDSVDELEKAEVPASSLPKNFDKLFVPIPVTGGIALPTWLLSQMSRYDLSQNIMAVPEIEAYLRQSEFIDYMGRKMTYLHCAWDELKAAGNLLKNHANETGVVLEWKNILATLRSWNYRANMDRERGQRKMTQTDDESISDKAAARGFETLPPSTKLKKAEIDRIFGGANRPPKPKRKKSSA